MSANSSEERHDKNQDSKIIKGSQIFKEDPEDNINWIQDNSNQNIANKLKYYQIKVNENKFNINSRHKVAKKGIKAEIPVKKINNLEDFKKLLFTKIIIMIIKIVIHQTI